MSIPLDQFEQYIDETILKRGFAYFKNDQVTHIEEISPGEYEVIVEGTENYLVNLTIKKNTIVESRCDCPYDGDICKHIVAAIFYLQKEVFDLEDTVTTKKKAREKNPDKKRKNKTVAEQVKDLLEVIPTTELKEFIQVQSKQNPQFRNLFLSGFAHYNSNESREFYSKQIKSILKAAAGRERFIFYNQVRGAAASVNAYLDTARKNIATQNYQSAIFICFAVLEEMTEAIEFADDSNGDIGESIEYAQQILFEISEDNISDEIKSLIFDYAISDYKRKIYEGWDWHINMLNLASEVYRNKEEAELIMQLTEVQDPDSYSMQAAQSIKKFILKKLYGDEAADLFMAQNITNQRFREELIQKEIVAKNYLKAIKLANEGIHQDKKDKPGLVRIWKNLLLDIAVLQGDKDQIFIIGKSLFLDAFSFNKEYYNLLKRYTPPEDWHSYVDQLIKDIKTSNSWRNHEKLPDIYINEEWWDKLFNYINERNHLSVTEYYESYLINDYKSEIIRLYELQVIDFLRNNAARNHYNTACRYMKRMLKLGAVDIVNHMMNYLRKQYPLRKALLDELDKI